ATLAFSIAGQDRGDGIRGALRIRAASHDAHVIADGGSETEKSCDAPGVRLPPVRVDRNLRLERTHAIDHVGGWPSVEPVGVRDGECQSDLVAARGVSV